MRVLQPVDLPANCLLYEVLLWVAFRRFPTGHWLDEQLELRDCEEELDRYGYAAEHPWIVSPLSDQECAAASLPADPRSRALIEYGVTEIEADEFWGQLGYLFQDAMQKWLPKYESVIEYPASQIYIALREGRLTASGKLLPDRDRQRALELLKAKRKGIRHLEVANIPNQFWSLSGIDWAANAARNHAEHYCWIKCSMEEVLKAFPIKDAAPAPNVQRVGAHYILDDPSEETLQRTKLRGRPPLPWDYFHVEVADLCRRSQLPTKKEAAIQYFQDWFERVFKRRVSRTAIGDKLKPYYDHFIRSDEN